MRLAARPHQFLQPRLAESRPHQNRGRRSWRLATAGSAAWRPAGSSARRRRARGSTARRRPRPFWPRAGPPCIRRSAPQSTVARGGARPPGRRVARPREWPRPGARCRTGRWCSGRACRAAESHPAPRPALRPARAARARSARPRRRRRTAPPAPRRAAPGPPPPAAAATRPRSSGRSSRAAPAPRAAHALGGRGREGGRF